MKKTRFPLVMLVVAMVLSIGLQGCSGNISDDWYKYVSWRVASQVFQLLF